MPYFNPFITIKPKPVFSPQGPMGVDDLNAYLNKYYAGGAADPLNMNQPVLPTDTNWGGIAQGAISGLSLGADAFGMANQSLGIETQAPGLERSATGEPIYNTGSFFNQMSGAKPQGATGGEIAGGVGKGAAAGFAAAGPIGAGVGAGVGAITTLVGGRARKVRQREELAKAHKSAAAAQKTYNEASQAFDQTQAAQADYLRRMDNTNRLWNLYS